MMSEKRFYLTENGVQDKEYEFSLLGESELVDIINGIVDENEQLKKENKQLQEKIKRLQEIYSRTEEEKEDYADLYNECRRLKLSDKAIKEAYAELNRKEIEKHSSGGVAYTVTIPDNSKMY